MTKRKRPDMVGNKFRLGKHPWNYGKKGVYSESTLKVMSELKVGRKLSEEHKYKIGLVWKGRRHTLEAKRKVAMAKYGDRNPAKRPEVRAKMSEAASRPEVINSKARKMKYSGTTIEVAMREELSRRGISFLPNKQIGKKFNVDIFIEPNIVIECDGDYWHSSVQAIEKDGRRDKELKELGYVIYRFWEHEIKADVSKCVDVINN